MGDSFFRHAHKYRCYPIQVRSDSEWCVKTLTGEYRTRLHGELFSEIQGLEDDMEVEYVHVRRSRERGNREANRLGKLLIQEGKHSPEEL